MSHVLDRRLFLTGAGSLALQAAAAAKEQTHRFRTADVEVEMAIKFYDRYASRGFWFNEQSSNRSYCLSGSGEEGRNCLPDFRGSLAIVRYRVKPRSRTSRDSVLREYVRTVDRDARLPERAPFERSIVLNKGVGSDLQAFGYEPSPEEQKMFDRNGGPWYLHRQDLYLEPERAPFLILYWKHALTSIRVLDLIPGDHTSVETK